MKKPPMAQSSLNSTLKKAPLKKATTKKPTLKPRTSSASLSRKNSLQRTPTTTTKGVKVEMPVELT